MGNDPHGSEAKNHAAGSHRVEPLNRRQIDKIKAVGGGIKDLRALVFSKSGHEREKLLRWFIHYFQHGDDVLRDYDEFDEAARSGDRLALGSLAANALFRRRKYQLTDNIRAGYLIALRIKYPDRAEMFVTDETWPLPLVRSGWNPLIKNPADV